MTEEEELAEEYLKDDSKWLIEDNEGNLINITKKVKEAYLAGLKAKTQWHDLHKAPEDLPKKNGNYLLSFIGAKGSYRANKKCVSIMFYDTVNKTWNEKDNLEYIPYFENKEVVLAWREVPIF